jgi:hypothetical protein
MVCTNAANRRNPVDPIIVIKTGGNIWDTDPYGEGK